MSGGDRARTPSPAVASLPMYDWPEVQEDTDRFWYAICDRLADAGIEAPEKLSRAAEDGERWTDPDLILSQTCGYPFATTLSGQVALVGTPAYALDCPTGQYFSVIVARREDSLASLAELAKQPFAFNEAGSQSGFRALARYSATRGIAMPDQWIETGAHRLSIHAVAEGLAAFAAIDAVTWQLARHHEPAAAKLAIVATTDPTPGLPMITSLANGGNVPAIAHAVEQAIAGLDNKTREALFLTGFVRTTPQDYASLV